MVKKEKIKIISLHDVVALLLITILVAMPFIVALATPTQDNTDTECTVTARNLAIFAALSYADIENIEGKNYEVNKGTVDEIYKVEFKFKPKEMVTDDDLKTIMSSKILNFLKMDVDLSGNKEVENTYNFLFYNLATTDEVKDWEIIDYTKLQTIRTKKENLALFTGMTFRKGDELVIALRGTDFDDIGDWVQDLVGYGLAQNTRHQTVAGKYVTEIAKKAIEENPNTRIYITGHSLGGYIAQIAGAELLKDENLKYNLEEIAYFNGMGLNYISNITNKFNKSIFSEINYKLWDGFDSLQRLMRKNSIAGELETTQNEAIKILKDWHSKGGKLILYRIKGDLISAFGTHYGEVKEYEAYEGCVKHHHVEVEDLELVKSDRKKVKTIINIMYSLGLTNKNESEYIDKYDINGKYGKTWLNLFLNYIWTTHETDNFFGIDLEESSQSGFKQSQDDNVNKTKNYYIKGKITAPSNIKKKDSATATLTITTNGKITNPKLKASDFKISSSIIFSKIAITSVSEPVVSKIGNETTYKYTLKLKTGNLLEIAKIYIKKGTIKINNSVSNEKISSNIINIK